MKLPAPSTRVLPARCVRPCLGAPAGSQPRRARQTRCYSDLQTIENSKRLPYGSSGSFAEDMAEFCAPSFVQWSNDAVPGSTEIRVQVLDYPGVLRVICWVLNGMDVRVESAKLRVEDDNMLDDTFIVKSRTGQQLSARRAQELAERVEDFVMYCSKVGAGDVKEWTLGAVHINNTSNETRTEITLLEEGIQQGFLLDIASVLSGVGVNVREADIRLCDDCQSDPALEVLSGSSKTAKAGRVFKFLVEETGGGKLNEQSANAVLYTLNMLLGKGHAPTTVPLAYMANHAT